MKRSSVLFFGVGLLFGLLIVSGLIVGKRLFSSSAEATYDLSLVGGRVIDPETGTDLIMNVGVSGGKIALLSSNEIHAKRTLNAEGLVVAPGFINLNVHTMDNQTFKMLAYDGVTTALELEGGTDNIEAFYKGLRNKSHLNYGASVGHIPIRKKVFRDPGEVLPSGPAATSLPKMKELRLILKQIEKGLKEGALGVGLALAYTPSATQEEVIKMFHLAAKHQAPVFVHLRFSGNKSLKGLTEVIAASAITGASLHVLHLTSIGGAKALSLLNHIENAKKHSHLDITTDLYPYRKGMTDIQSVFLSKQFMTNSEKILQKGFIHVESGQPLTIENFDAYREQGGWVVFGNVPGHVIDKAIQHPGMMVASDAIVVGDGKGHPRNAGTFAKVFRHYVRERRLMPLGEAIAKASLFPARRLEKRSPTMRWKGRIQIGADADIVVFDPNTFSDRATYEDPSQPSKGVHYLIVNGVLLIDKATFQFDAFPGKAVRSTRLKL